MIINPKLNDSELLDAIYKAALEYEKRIDKSYLIIGKNVKSPYFGFECYFLKRHFMHLLGIKSKILTANEFFDKCCDFNGGIGEGIKISDCSPSRKHNRTTINEKCSCSAKLFKIENAKYLKTGLKDKITQYVDFEYIYGNEATLGFKQDKYSSFPITIIPNSIDNFSTQKYRVIFVFEKLKNADKYENLIMEAKCGLFNTLYSDLPDKFKKLIRI